MVEVLKALQKIKEQGPPVQHLVLGENARLYRKAKTVHAYRSKDPVTVLKDWGKSASGPGAYIVLGGDDDVYTLDEQTFHTTYEPVAGGSDE